MTKYLILGKMHLQFVFLLFSQVKMIESLHVKPNDSALMTDIKQTIGADLQKRYQSPEIKDFLLLAAFLDPRFKTLPQVTEEVKAKVHQDLAAKAIFALNTVKVILCL